MNRDTHRVAPAIVAFLAGFLVLMLPAPAVAIPTDPTAPPACVGASASSLSLSADQLTLGQQTTVTWSFTPGAGCNIVDVRVWFREKIGGNLRDVGLQGASGSVAHAPQGNGQYVLEVSTGGLWWELRSGTVTVGVPVINGRPTVGITRNDQAGLFAQAVGLPNAMVWIGGQVELDLSRLDEVIIAPGVSIQGDRSVYPQGPRLFTTTFPSRLMYIGTSDGPSDNVHISGIRFDGMEPSDPCDSAGDTPESTLFTVSSSVNVEIDHNEFTRWRGSAIDIHDTSGRINIDNAGAMWIHDNFLHHNQHPEYCGPNPFGEGHGAGYGVNVSQGGFALITGNIFDTNRHDVAGHGSPGDGYFLRGNLFFNAGVGRRVLYVDSVNHHVDMHGLTKDCPGTWEHLACGPAGEYIRIANNTFAVDEGDAIQLRGEPSDPRGGEVADNAFAQPLSRALTETVGGYLHDVGGNSYEQIDRFLAIFDGPRDPATGWRCDFDRDGIADTFRATGAAWWYFSSVTGRWALLREMTQLPTEQIRDVNGDGRCDAVVDGTVYYTGSVAPFDVPLPAQQTTLTGTPVNLQLTPVGAASVAWRATGLPPGVWIDSGTGLIQGAPTQAGLYTVRFRARDGRDNIVDGHFLWQVNVNQVRVPNVLGSTSAQATSALQSAGLIATSGGTIVIDDPSDNGRVVQQSPAAGTSVSPGSSVRITLGKYKAGGCGPVAC